MNLGQKRLYESLREPLDLDRLKRCIVAFLMGSTDSEGYVDN